MRSKVHPKYTTKYRVGNGSAYEQALVQRGDVTLWLSADATDAWRPSPSGRPGAPKTFSDCAIETALTRRLVFRVPLRQAEGFLRSVLSLMGVDLAAPDHTTLSRRSQSLAVEFRRIPSRGPIHLIVDSTGRSIVGEGEWAAVNHGGRGHRGGKTRHLAGDRGGVIVAHALTEPTVDAATIGIDLIETVDEEIARVTADAAYDTVAFYAAAEMRDATVVVPPSKTARAYPPPNVGVRPSRRWWSLQELVVESLVVSLAMVVFYVLVDETTQMPLAERDHACETHLFDRPDEPLGIGVEIGTLRRQPNRLNTGALQDLAKDPRIEGIAVVNQMARPAQTAIDRVGHIAGLLLHPRAARLRVDPGDGHVAGSQLDHEEDEVPPEPRPRPHLDGEQIAGRQALPVRLPERLPGHVPAPLGRRVDSVVVQDPLHRGPGDSVAEV